MIESELRDTLRSKPALVVGLGITGIETALFLNRCGIEVLCVERSSEDAYHAKSLFANRLSELHQRKIPVSFEIDGESVRSIAERCGIAVVSPGISLLSPTVSVIKSIGVPFISELELGLLLSGLPYIMVTGSNGKTTTVNLISAILTDGGIPNFLCGNVGTPLLSKISKEDFENGALSNYRYLVVEASSYQLESTSTIKPKVGILLNISENHLERHGTLERYLATKFKMLAQQDAEDLALLNSDDEKVRAVADELKGEVGFFGTNINSGTIRARINYKPSESRDTIELSLRGSVEQYDVSRCALLGVHNRFNIAASILAARQLDIPKNSIERTIVNFAPLPHRIEPLREVEGVKYVNDSKSTTVASTVAAVSAVIEAYPARKVVLLIGGQAKTGSWSPLVTLLKDLSNSLRAVICFGKDRALLKSVCESGGLSVDEQIRLEDGFHAATKAAQSGDIVLLSPGCASFDQFKSFEERGDSFRKLVSEL